MAPPRSDNEESVDLYVKSLASRMDMDDEWVATQQVVPYDETNPTFLLHKRTTTTRQRRKASKQRNHKSSMRPRAEVVFPLKWTANSYSPEWDGQRSRVTTTTRLPLYRSQDRLLDSDQTLSPHEQEITCDISMTTLQRNFQDAALLSSAHLKGIHHHDGTHSSSVALGFQRQRRDTVSLALQTSGPKYGVAATVFYSTRPFFRVAAHGDVESKVRGNVTVRPDVQITSRSPELGVSMLSGTDWDLRCGMASKSFRNFDWKPTLRFRWKYPIAGQFVWKHGSMVHCESSWKATSGRHGAQCIVAASDLNDWKCILAYTLGDVTLRIPIVIASAASNWQLFALRWLLASAVSHTVHKILAEVFWNDASSRSLPNNDQNIVGRHTALMQQSFMKRQAMMRYRAEEKNDGLLIETATYRLTGAEPLDVTTVLRFWVSDSKLELFADNKRCMMLGFYDLSNDIEAPDSNTRHWANWETVSKAFSRVVRSDQTKNDSSAKGPTLDIHYMFRGQRYFLTAGEDEHVSLPSSRATTI